MKTIVITGSTRGIGYGLADEFLARGCAVVVSGRSQPSVEEAVSNLAAKHSPDRLLGQPCDVTANAQVAALWTVAKIRFGQIDIWINNAGLNNPQLKFWEQNLALMDAVVRTNVVGSMYGAAVALRGMIEQGGGQIYNMQGAGSNGGIHVGKTLYGVTKRSINYLSRALIVEAKNTTVQVGTLSPGMVLTGMLLDNAGTGAERERILRIFNILAERVETVAPFLVDKILANDKHGTHIKYLTRLGIMRRMIMAPFNKRDIVSDLIRAEE